MALLTERRLFLSPPGVHVTSSPTRTFSHSATSAVRSSCVFRRGRDHDAQAGDMSEHGLGCRTGTSTKAKAVKAADTRMSGVSRLTPLTGIGAAADPSAAIASNIRA